VAETVLSLLAIVIIVLMLVSRNSSFGVLRKRAPFCNKADAPVFVDFERFFRASAALPGLPHVLEVLQYASGRRQTGALHLQRNSSLKSKNIYFYGIGGGCFD